MDEEDGHLHRQHTAGNPKGVELVVSNRFVMVEEQK
jgi:hypothetical protein